MKDVGKIADDYKFIGYSSKGNRTIRRNWWEQSMRPRLNA